MGLVLPPLPTVRDVVKLYRLNAVKSLSQNFLFNDGLINQIVKQAGKSFKGMHVVEVGPGPGGLTRSIMRKLPEKLTVVETDRRFEPTLQMLQSTYEMNGKAMDIVFNDVLRTDISCFFDESLKKDWNDRVPPIRVIGNLPFNIATPLIIQWLQGMAEKKNAWTMGRVPLVLTFQKEVAERIVAHEKHEQRCRLSIMAQAWSEPELKFIIPGNKFVPAPDVDVGVVKFVPLVKPRTNHNFQLFEKITRHMFSFRQKHTYKSALTLFPPEYQKQLGPLLFEIASVKKEMVPTQLSVEDVDRLCTAYAYLCEKHPEIKTYNYRASKKILNFNYCDNVIIEDYEEDGEQVPIQQTN